MKTKDQCLKNNGIDLEKDFTIPVYTKIRFAMEEYAIEDNKRELLRFAKFADKSPHLLIFDVLKEYLRQSK